MSLVGRYRKYLEEGSHSSSAGVGGRVQWGVSVSTLRRGSKFLNQGSRFGTFLNQVSESSF